MSVVKHGTASLSLAHVVREPAAGALPDGTRPPLLLLLHGVGSHEGSMAANAQLYDPRFLVVAARSPIALEPRGFGFFHVTFTPQGSQIDRDEAAAGWAHVARFVDEAVDAYGADASRVYVAGFSQGAIMALAALLTAPEKIAGAAAMSGRLLPEVLPHVASVDALRGKSVLIVHGTDDEKLGVHLARSAMETLTSFPLSITYRELPMTHTMTADSLGVVSTWLSARLDETRSA